MLREGREAGNSGQGPVRPNHCNGLLRGQLGDGEVEVMQHFPDVPESHPYFGWIEEVSVVAHESEDPGIGVERLIQYLPGDTNSF